MNAPAEIKPAIQKRPRRATKPKVVSAAEFSDLEIRAALAVRKFPPEKVRGWVEMLERMGADFELKAAAARPTPALRLVVGGAL